MALPRTLHHKLDAAAQRELHTNEHINTFACCTTNGLQRCRLYLVPPADVPVFLLKADINVFEMFFPHLSIQGPLQLQLRIPIGIMVTNDGLTLSDTFLRLALADVLTSTRLNLPASSTSYPSDGC